ncbi:Uncharacterised protein [Bordetella pertussis]|nr:Uncharacterised protein [Bordetella pertussis]CFP69028.1 Uncharacterised protein [Bordetella pertussis]CFW40031.1 Uncharacterised protein [Bordetella pertussis]
MATSGRPMPARSASWCTVSSSQASRWLAGALGSMTRAPVLHLAMGLLISSEMIAPVKPITAEKISRPVRFSPCAVRKRSTPRMRIVADSTTMTARLVIRNRKMRFMLVMVLCERKSYPAWTGGRGAGSRRRRGRQRWGV